MERAWYEHIPGVQTEEALIHTVMDSSKSIKDRATASAVLGAEAAGIAALTGALIYAYVPEARFAVNKALSRITDDHPLPTYIHGSAQIAEDAVIEPGAVIAKGAVVGKGATIGRNAMLESESMVGANSVIGSGARIGKQTEVRAFANVGANARLDERNIIADRVKIGAGADIGANNRFNLGSEIGPDVWIGHNNVFDVYSKVTDAKVGYANTVQPWAEVRRMPYFGDLKRVGFGQTAESVESALHRYQTGSADSSRLSSWLMHQCQLL